MHSREEGPPPAVGMFWACVWLFWLIPPLVQGLQRLDQTRGWVGVSVILAFAVIYVWHWMTRWTVFSDDGCERVPLEPGSVGRWLAMAILAVVAMVALGQDGMAPLIFTAVSAMWTFSIPVAVGISLASGLAYTWAMASLPGWHFDGGSLIGLTFATIAVIAGRLAGGRQKQLERSRRENARLAVDEERNRVARDVHDILGHSLTVITLKAELAGRLVEVDPARAKAEIADLERLSRDALADVRRAVTGFREVTLSGELARAREALRTAGIRADLPTAVDDVPSDLREVFGWAVREGVTNVIRHSGARHCVVTVTGASVTVRDDGVGAGSAYGTGNGLQGLRERADAAGLQLSTAGDGAQGFELTLAVPAPRVQESPEVLEVRS